jgi:hypothetical protein
VICLIHIKNCVSFQGYECVEIDSTASGETCIGHDTDYNDANVDFMAYPTDESIFNSCMASNGGVDNCAVKACTVEVSFLRDWWPLQQQVYSGTFDPEMARLSHDKDFDTSAECAIIRGGYSERQCCGKYPTRFPFRTLNGDRACCDERTYQTSSFECCDDSIVSLSC